MYFIPECCSVLLNNVTFLLTRSYFYAYIVLDNSKSLILVGFKLYEELIKTISSLCFKYYSDHTIPLNFISPKMLRNIFSKS